MLKFGKERDELKCSFCGKSEHAVQKLIAGKGVYICDNCVEICNEILQRDMEEDEDSVIGTDYGVLVLFQVPLQNLVANFDAVIANVNALARD